MSEPQVPGNTSGMADELGKQEKVSQSTELVRLAQQHYRFAVADDGRCFAVELDGPNVARPLRGGSDGLRQVLSGLYFDRHKRAASQSALADALTVVEGRAARADREPLAIRVAQHDGAVVLDLGTADGRAVIIDKAGWRIESRSPVVFRRTELTMPLPTPERGGSLDELRTVLNISDESWPVLVGWLIVALLSSPPHPILLLIGLQGAGKSTAAQMIATVIDPSAAPLQAPPTDPSGWTMTASGSWVVTVDNLSGVSGWLSDALCRAVTGEARVARQLYSDNALSVVTLRRCIILTTIDAGALRGDLAERLLTVELERIDAKSRRTDSELRAAYASCHPRVLGALLDLLAQVLAVLDDVVLAELPRLADFAQVLGAVDRVTGWQSLPTYLGQSDRLAVDVVAGDAVASAVVQFVEQRHTWAGTATELLELLTGIVAPDGKRPPKNWPSNSQALSGALKRAIVVLEQVGVAVESGHVGRGKSKARRITLARVESEPDSSSPSSPSSPHGADLGRDGDADGDDGTAATWGASPHASPDDNHDDLQLFDDGDDGDDGDASSTPVSWELQRCPMCGLLTVDPATGRCMSPQCF